MKAEEKIVADVLFSCYAVCIFIGKKTEFGDGGEGGEGQEQRDRRAKF